jgi:SAM-dependent methyltransferase
MPTTLPQFPSDWFRRQDESPDSEFYNLPRLMVHIDDATIEAIRVYLGAVLPPEGVVLDLMSAWRSHLPDDYAGRVVGLGMNAVEMKDNHQLTASLVHDLNTNPVMPLPDEGFNSVYVVVSIQYMTRPLEVFADVWRVLKPGGTFHVIFSTRMFPTKAVAIWQAMTQPQKRAELIGAYFAASGNWTQPEFLDRTTDLYADPVYIVRSTKPV